MGKKQKRVKFFPHRAGRNRHHILAEAREGPRKPRNMLLIRIERHDSWHRLFGLLTIKEIIKLLNDGFEIRKGRKGYQHWAAVFGDKTPAQAIKLLVRIDTAKANQRYVTDRGEQMLLPVPPSFTP